jgi:hypothetical protein
MLSHDEAITLGVRKYRELYPKGAIPHGLEEKGVLGATADGTTTSVHLAFWLRGQRDPLVLFKASVSRSNGEVTVQTNADWHQLEGKEFEEAKCVT